MECLTPDTKPRLNELNDIAKTAGYEVVGQVTQHRDAVDGGFCVGEGEIDEIAELLRKDPVDAAVFARQLSAGQVFRIKKKLGEAVRVLDRNLLILEVFDKRGASAEAKLHRWRGYGTRSLGVENRYACKDSLANKWGEEAPPVIRMRHTRPGPASELAKSRANYAR